MRLLLCLLPLLAGVRHSLAADDTTTTTSGTSTGTGTTTNAADIFTLDGTITSSISDATLPTGNYITYSSTITLSDDHGVHTSTITSASANVTSSANSTQSTVSTTSQSVTVLVGGHTTTLGANSTANATTTASASASSTPVVNTQPCNGYAEFCNRKYSNITMVAAHNSPFDKVGNAASNQAFDVTSQLNDGIRMLQFQTHYTNDTMYLCHTSCEILNMGTLEVYLTDVAKWMKQHPYDVVTILIGNYDYVSPQNFTTPIQNSGLMDLVYTPPKIPMALDDWPTLSSMILSAKRAVVFMDYQANQTAIPWLMDEFSQIWETPFSPTDPAFPCTIQRPPGLLEKDARNRMYMANHNLNVDINFAGLSLLIPNTAQLSETNAVNGTGSLGAMNKNCTLMHDRAPNFLLVDYYNYGNFNGSVFEVAADANNVTYSGKCCGTTSAASNLLPGSNTIAMLMVAAGVQILASMF